MGAFFTSTAELWLTECSGFSLVYVLFWFFLFQGTLLLGRALVVKLYLAQKMQISPKIPRGSNDEFAAEHPQKTSQSE